MSTPNVPDNLFERFGPIFTPELWGTYTRFRNFYGRTYSFDDAARSRLLGINGHLGRASRLLALAKRMAPTLDEDAAELEATGHSHGDRAHELAAVVDSAICEIYSTLDCFRHVLKAIYPNHKNLKDSTRGTFQRGHKGELDPKIPEAIRNAIMETKDWFPRLRIYRDAITHNDVGFCVRDKKTLVVGYIQPALGKDLRFVSDAFGMLADFINKTNEFLGVAFHALNATLKDEESLQLCGVYGGRGYQRFIKPSEATDFSRGRCSSFTWFEKEAERDPRLMCPLASHCGAYARAKGQQTDTSCVSEPSRVVSQSCLEGLQKEWAKWPAIFAEMDERLRREREEQRQRAEHSSFFIPDLRRSEDPPKT
jgi:hypothetical protein